MRLHEINDQRPLLIVPIGPSGAGKTTLFKQLQQDIPALQSFSFDTLRHEWYDPQDYKRAFELSTQDKSFDSRTKAHFYKMIKNGQPLFIDNTNLSPKRRKMYIEAAHKYGYKTVAVVLTTPLEELIKRQTTRGDKNVPEEAVRRQFSSMVLPLEGEFDEVITFDGKTTSN